MSYVDIAWPRLSICLALVLLAAGISRRFELGLEKSMLIGAVRAFVQLVAIGYALVFIFGEGSPVPVLAALLVMLVVAASVSAKRVDPGVGFRALFPLSFLAVLGGSAVALVPVFLWVVRADPWYSGRYLIPLSGMMMSSAMNVVAQVFERIFARAREDRDVIEQLLALGATPRQALLAPTKAAVRAALIPTLNGLATVGLVSLPGMMTGQILSGTDPQQAVRYQVMIMYQLVAVAAVSGGLAATLAQRLLFTGRHQLHIPIAEGEP